MQQKDEQIDVQLWEYIDGTCTEADRQRIATLVRTDAAWEKAYRELLSFNTELIAEHELHEPHMRFTQNVMDAVGNAQPLPAMRRYINRPLMRGIAAFFIVGIALSLLAMLLSTNWSAPVQVAFHIPQIPSLPSINFSGVFTSQSVIAAIGLVVMVGLVFLEQVLRPRFWKQG